jgi:glycosyltransferase involved in cell wall biosynthesis
MGKSVIIIGPAHPLRGGLGTFNHRFCKELLNQGYQASIISYSLQYPGFLFPGKTQYSTDPAPEQISIRSLINSINPFNWLRVGYLLKKERPNYIIVRYWIPFMGPALGTILRLAKKNKHTQIICLADNIIPHEKRFGDKLFTKYFIKPVDKFITMSEQVKTDVAKFTTEKPVSLLEHPLYDNFGEAISKAAACNFLKLDASKKIILFFGFVRAYKGLDLLLQAFNSQNIKTEDIQLVIAGEFYEDEKPYLEQINQNINKQNIHLHNYFIPDSEVFKYLCAADCVIQPYKHATQSGVTPLAYYFEKPTIVTNVGGLPQLVNHKQTGLICEGNPESIKEAILSFYKMPSQQFTPYMQQRKKELSWANFVQKFINN